MSEDIDDDQILEEMIADLRNRLNDRNLPAAEQLDFDDRRKLNDQLMKAIGMRRKKRGKGRGFDLGQG
jgi:hypothetical protein